MVAGDICSAPAQRWSRRRMASRWRGCAWPRTASPRGADRARRAAEPRALQLVLPTWTERDRIASPLNACDQDMEAWAQLLE
eukprot:9492585-Pyramimonas_sp.AAC.2